MPELLVAMASARPVPLNTRVAARVWALLLPLVALLARDALAFLPPPAPPAAAAAAASQLDLPDATLALEGHAGAGAGAAGYAGASAAIAMVSNHGRTASTSSTRCWGRRRSKARGQPIIAATTRARRIGSRADFCRVLFASSSTTDDDPSSATEAVPAAAAAAAAVAVTGVTLKLAIDSSPACWGIADQSTSSSATTQKESKRFTSPQSLDMVHRLRSVSDCVLVGRGTVAADDCTLTVRRGCEYKGGTVGREQPARVVLDSNLGLLRDHVDGRCDAKYRLFEDGFPVIIYHLGGTTTADDDDGDDDDDIGGDDVEAFLRDRPAIALVDASKLEPTALELNDEESAIISPRLVVRDLHRRGLHHVMVEGGGATALSFLRAGVVDRAIIVKASVRFDEPLDSHISADVMEKEGGLTLVGTSDDGDDGDGDGDNLFGGDSLQYWVRGDGDGRWPSSNDFLTEWP